MSVRMRHPGLPPDQTIAVDERAVPHHGAAGWQVVTHTPEPAAEPEPQEQPAVGGESEPVAPKRRRAQKED